MSRYIKNSVVTAVAEVTAGTDANPTGVANAILVTDVTITPLDAQNIDRALIRGYFGASEQLVGPASVKVSYSVELAGSGTSGTAPAWGVLLQGCAFGEGVLATPARVEYSPVSTGLKSLSKYCYDDGALHKLLGAMGNASLSAKIGDRPMLKFDWIGLDGGLTAASASATLTAWKKPVSMTKVNVVDFTVGAAYAAGVLSGGTPYPSTGIEINFGNSVAFTALLSSETVDITDRVMTGSVELDLTAAQEVAMMAIVKANTLQTIAMTIGTTAGNKIIIFGRAVQMLNPKKVEKNGKRLIGYDLRFCPTPTGSGNDELLIAHV